MSAAIQAWPGMKQQTFIAAFSAGQGSKAGGIGYQEECAPTLKASESGTNMAPSVLCLNDQGGSRMDITENMTATLRAQMDGHPPLVLSREPELFENHGIDSRYTGLHEVAPTMSARYGTGGNNVPLISQTSVFSEDECADLPHAETYCIAGNIIDRQDNNGGNGIGVQPDISYTVTATTATVYFPSNGVTNMCRMMWSALKAPGSTRTRPTLWQMSPGWTAETVRKTALSGTLQSKTDGGYS